MMSLPAATAVQHLLFFFLVVVTPIWDYYETSRLKQDPQSHRKIRYYQTLSAWLWIAAGVACLAVGWRPLFTIAPSPGDAAWLLGHAWTRHLFGAAIAVFMALVLVPAVIAIWKNVSKKPRKYSSADALESLSFFLPATWTERRWFGFLCVTAGICEEILFRGFLLHYLHVSPLSVNLTLALLVSAIICGLQHLYQGSGGAASTVVGGLLFGVLFLLTGNLLLPILFHAVMDLRILLLLRPPAAVKAPAA
jgi:membrane protease YdiL (CAAX protease family)